jgi:23S rRNA (cytidine2498-2'-O)-methyltransferase
MSHNQPLAGAPTFFFATCQIGAEPALKGEVARRWPDVHPSYSRPGFVTFKVPVDHALRPDFDLQSVFARAYALSLGKAMGQDIEASARTVWQLCGERPVERLHVWQRDLRKPGDDGYEPSLTPLAAEVHAAILRACSSPDRLVLGSEDPVKPARRGEYVLDCALVEPDEWWVGIHRATSIASRWPGGMIPLEQPPHAVSRAWLKMEEALRWSQLPFTPGARCVEIGSAPGGASQALLDRGLQVIGIDPAEMHPTVLEHPGFTHLRKRAAEVRRREFRKVRWLTADMNVAPNYTLEVVEEIVKHPEVNIRGMLLTLKLFEWKLADNIPEYLQRIRDWGFNHVAARQLQHNRQEICVVALQKPFHRKPLRR